MFAASAKATVDREDWDMTWNMAVETGGFLVSKKIDHRDRGRGAQGRLSWLGRRVHTGRGPLAPAS